MGVMAHQTDMEALVQAPHTKPVVRRVPAHRPPTRHRPTGAPRVIPRSACTPRQPRLSLAWVLATAAVVCAAVYGLGALAGSVGPTLPSATTVVRVQPGESLWELAGRVAPDSDASSVVARIRELNGVDGGVQPGQPLTVPFEK
jgi:LysM domain-containing protein